MFLFCYFGGMVADSFEKLSEDIFECGWETFPCKLQTYLLPIISVAHQPVHAEAFGGTPCTRQTFKTVIKKSHKNTIY